MPGVVSPGRLLRGGGMWLWIPACTVFLSPVRHYAGSFNNSNSFNLQMNEELLLFPCINHIFLFCIFDALPSWDLAESGGTTPARVSQFLEVINKLPGRGPFIYKPTNPEFTPQPPPLWSFHTQGYYPPTLITPRQVSDNQGHSYAPEPAEIIQSSQS